MCKMEKILNEVYNGFAGILCYTCEEKKKAFEFLSEKFNIIISGDSTNIDFPIVVIRSEIRICGTTASPMKVYNYKEVFNSKIKFR